LVNSVDVFLPLIRVVGGSAPASENRPSPYC